MCLFKCCTKFQFDISNRSTLQRPSLFPVKKNNFFQLIDTFLYQNNSKIWFENFWFFNFYTQIEDILNKFLVEKLFLDALLHVKFFRKFFMKIVDHILKNIVAVLPM